MKKKTLKFTILILILVILYLIISSTYSKYVTGIDDQTTSLHISNWNIKLNNKDILKNQNFSGDVKLKKDSNSNIAENIIAPTSSGTFEVTLDSTGTELPYNYEFEFAENVDTKSSYITSVKAHWGTTYQLDFYLDYSYLDHPIVYEFNTSLNTDFQGPWVEGVAWGLVYNDIPINYNGIPIDTETYGSDPVGTEITLTLPEGAELSAVYNVTNYKYDSKTNTISFTPLYYNWYGDNNANKETCKYIPDWNPNITIVSQSNPNMLHVLIQITYNDDLEDTENFWDAITADGRTVVKKNLPDFKVTKYQINDGEFIYVKSGDTKITGFVEPKATDETVKFKFKFYVEWYDGDGEVLNNSEDVTASKNKDNIYGTIPLSLTITQVDTTETSSSP